jgi:hypothetical protein
MDPVLYRRSINSNHEKILPQEQAMCSLFQEKRKKKGGESKITTYLRESNVRKKNNHNKKDSKIRRIFTT